MVDDEEVICLNIGEEFEEDGYEFIFRTDGHELLETIKRGMPDLLILDIRLAEEDGLDLLQDVRAAYPNLPVIINTAYDSFRYDSKSLSADYYVVKSYDLFELKLKVACCLNYDPFFLSESSHKIRTFIHSTFISQLNANIIDFCEQYDEKSVIFRLTPVVSSVSRKIRELSEQLEATKVDIISDLRGLLRVAKREVIRARREVRRYFVNEGKTIHRVKPDVHEKPYTAIGGWTILKPNGLDQVAERVRGELEMETKWLEAKLTKAMDKLKKGQLKEVPFGGAKGSNLSF